MQPMKMTEKQQDHTFREQASGHQWGEGRFREQASGHQWGEGRFREQASGRENKPVATSGERERAR